MVICSLQSPVRSPIAGNTSLVYCARWLIRLRRDDYLGPEFMSLYAALIYSSPCELLLLLLSYILELNNSCPSWPVSILVRAPKSMKKEHGVGLAGRLPQLKYMRERKFSLPLYLFVHSPVLEEQGVIKCEQPLRKQAANPYFLAENPLFRPQSPSLSSLVNTLPITKKNKHTVVTEAPEKYMCCFRASKFAPEGQFRLQLAPSLRTSRRD